MHRKKVDRKTVAVVILVIALGGLGYLQYNMVKQYYSLSFAKLDQQIAMTLAETGDENYDRTLLSNLISAIIIRDTVSFPVGMDSLRQAGRRFYHMYLTDRFTRASIPTDFEYAVLDQITMASYLASDGFENTTDWTNQYRLPLAGVIADDCSCAPYLEVRFKSLQSEAFGSIQQMVIPAFFCFLLLLFGFILLLIILREQKYLDRVKNDFINNLTHELKTPVFSISLATRIMREKGSDSPYLAQIEKDIANLKGNVEKVLELASIEDKKSLLSLRQVPLKAFLNRWSDEHRDADRVNWALTIGEGTEVLADEEHLKNALNNLLDNALKYSEKAVGVEASKEGAWVEISVRDQGPGIDKSDHEAIFTKFYRVQNGNNTTRGYGLGLSYVRQVVRMMNGEISIESAPGQGSIFKIKLPPVR